MRFQYDHENYTACSIRVSPEFKFALSSSYLTNIVILSIMKHGTVGSRIYQNKLVSGRVLCRLGSESSSLRPQLDTCDSSILSPRSMSLCLESDMVKVQ
jgi:hypothetical protein